MVDYLVKKGSSIIGDCLITPQEGEAICKMEKRENEINDNIPSSRNHDIVLLYESNENPSCIFNYNSIFVFTPKEKIGKDLLVKWLDKIKDISQSQYKIKEDRATGKYALYGLMQDDFELNSIVNSFMQIAEKTHFFYTDGLNKIIYYAIFTKSITGKESRQLKQEIINSRKNELIFKEEDIFDLA